jgi:hypothetical protein
MSTGYGSAAAYRQALEAALRDAAERSEADLNWLRRRHAFTRLLHRLAAAAPDEWVLKGGFAIELRRPGFVRATKDLDLALRRELTGPEPDRLTERLRTALDTDPDGDLFVFRVRAPTRMAEDAYGRPAWRFKLTVQLAGRTFSDTRVDVIARPDELGGLDEVTLSPGALAPPGAPARTILLTDRSQQFAEKLHALTRQYGSGESSRVRDLADLVMLTHDGLPADVELARAVHRVFRVRATHPVPGRLPEPPEGWAVPYRRLAARLGIEPGDLVDAHRLVADVWDAVRELPGADA